MSIFNEIDNLIKDARACESEAEDLLGELLPPGTIVTFRFGNMVRNHNAEVIRTRVHYWPEVVLRNLFTGKERRVPLSAIKGK